MNQNKEYTGLLCIKCENCGNIHMFGTTSTLKKYYCHVCGHVTALSTPPARLYVHCECGSRTKYLTNMRDKLVDVICRRCNAPVTVEWNHKKQLYGTVREVEHKR